VALGTPSHNPGDILTGVMLQITQHAEQLALLDEREAAHFREIATRLDELSRQLAESGDRAGAVHDVAARQAALLDALEGIDQQVAALARRLTDMAGTTGADDETYQPAPGPRWWKLNGPERKEALNRLRAWVEQVYFPEYGHLAAALGTCWDQHPLCLYGLDWLMELWTVLYLAPGRTTALLASQAEWQTRLLPALAEQMHIETARCAHRAVSHELS
jgi:hypothetical protein